MDCLESGIAPLRVQIDPPKNLQVPRGGRAQWYCHIIGHSGPNLRLEWTKVGTNTLPDSAIQTNGQLVIDDVRESDSGQYRCTATGPHQFATDDATLVVTKPQPNTPVVSPPSQTVDVGVPARFECNVPGNDDAELHWRKEDGSPLGYGVTDEHGVLTFSNVQPSDAGAYVCSAEATEGEGAIDSSPAYLNINPTERTYSAHFLAHTQDAPAIDTPTKTVVKGEMAELRCHISRITDVELHWRREDGNSLTNNSIDEGGTLIIPNAQETDAAKPTPIVEIATQTVDEGTTVTFHCNLPTDANGGELHWRREDETSLSYDANDEDGILTITNVRLSDAGTYICFTEDPETGDRIDSAPASLIVNPVAPTSEIQSTPMVENPIPVVENSTQTIEEGGEVILKCKIPNREDIGLHWRREDGETLPSEAIDDNGILRISNIQQSNAGNYICYTEDEDTGERVDSTPAQINVIPSEPQLQETPVVEPINETVEEGATVTFRCSFPEKEDVELHWRRENDDSFGNDTTDIDGVLTITNAQLTDTGKYFCFTENSHGQRIDSTPAELFVNQNKSKAERKPLADTTIVSIQEGGTVKLHCTIPNKESDELHWRREDGGFLPYDAIDNYGVLTIPQAQLSDSGIYICYSEDSITGERIDSTPTKLEVNPIAPAQTQRIPVVETPTVTVEQGETIRLRCNIPTKTDDVQLHWRREDGRALRWDISEDDGLLIISNVQPSDAGAYICSAEDTETGETIDSAPAYLTVNPSALKGVTPHVESAAESFEEGETITLRCTLPDKGNVELHWRREDGNSLGYDATDEDGVLTMTNVKPTDSGAYICSAEDHETGERVDSVPAYITITPRTTKAPLIENPVETVDEGEAVRFLCHPPDNEEAEVHWRREDGNPLGYGISEEDGALIIPHAQLSDAGAYICSVEDPDGRQIDSSRAYLTVHASTSAPKGLATPLIDNPSQTIQEGDAVTFRCSLPSLRNAQIHWRRQDGSSFGYDITDEDGILTIPRVEAVDAGAYICTVEDPETGESVESAPAYLTVNPSTPRQPEVDSPTQSVDEGETVTFRCSVPGVDDAVIHWRREDGSPLGYGVTDEDGVLTIPRAEPSDAGTYVCWNDDPHGGAPIESQPAYLTVNPAPLRSPEVEPPEQTVQQGDTVTFRCNVPGDPDAELHWRKEDGEQFRNEITDDEGVLTITDVQPSDAGAYICTADDPDGPIESPLVYLIVNPRISDHRPVVNTEREVVNEGENVVLRCEMPTKIDNVELHWRREDGAEFGYGTTDENGVLTIQRVQQSDAGAYICSAEPQNGGTRQDSPITYLIVNPNSPKSPIVDASSDSVNEGAPVRFRCYVPGVSGAQLEWRREDGNALNDEATDENGILTIMQTKASDAGAYICSAKSSDGGNPIDSSPIHLNVVPTPPRAPIVLSAEETVDEGSPVRLRCYLPGSRDAELHWRREDGNPLGKYVTDEQGILTIPRARTSDAGAYICSAKEPDSIESLDSQPARINVNAMELPTLVVETSSDSVNEGQAVRLQCHAPGRPDVELHWRREDGASLSSSATEQRGILTIMQTQPSDSGTYICSTGQPGDDNVIDSSPVHLTVTPSLPQTPVVDASSESVTEGQPVRLQCHVPGRPDLELKWRRDDDKPLSTSAIEQRGTLTIMRTEPSDSGAYICSTVVTNGENAIHSSPIHLTVTSTKPKGPLLVTTEETVNEGDLVRLRCYLPGQSDNGLHWRRQDGSALNEDTTDEHGILTIPRASPSDSGYYICSFGHPPVDSPPARITVNAVTPGIPVVEPLSVSISVGHPARFRCYVPGNPRAELHWRKQDGRELGAGITETQGYLSISKAQQSDAGAYVCSAQSSPGGSTVDSQPVSLTVNPIAPTKPVVNPPTQTIDEGGSARYQCYVPGNPGARLNWRKEDGSALGYDVTDNNGILTITNARISDAGAYICSATDQQTGSAALSSPVYLSVNQNRPVNPVVDPQSQTVDEGASARFRCHVPGNPDAQLRWRKEDGSAFGYGVTDSQGVLSFARVVPSDAGAYVCTAQGPRGVSPIDSSPAYLGVNPRRPSNPVVEPPTQTVNEGDPAKFRCYLPGVPDAQLSWRKQDGSSLGHAVTDNRGLLSFPRVQPSDAGAYVCTAQDQRGGSPTDSPPAYLNVNPRRPGSTPTLMIDPPSQTVNENEPATFKCWVPGVLACELTWHKEYIGGPLPYGVYQSGGTLKIPRAQLHDAGNYICTASNQYGIGQSPPGKLIVIRPPQPPRVDPPEMTVNDGDPARFRCWVPGDPAARLSWRMRSGEPIPYGAQENEGTLNFPRARHSHAGGYVCTATDPEGRNPPIQSSEVRLNIRQPKTPMVEPTSQTVKEGDSVKFHCWLPGNEDAEIHWRRVDGNPLGYGVSEDQNGTLSIPIVHEADIGEYICSALDPESERSSDSITVRLDVTKLQRPEVDPPEQTVSEGDPVRFHCWVRGNADAQIRWSREDGEPLPQGVSANGNGMLYIPNVQLSDAGNYVCSAIDPERGEPTESTSARLIVHAPESERDILQVEPQEQTVEEDDSAQIICKLNGQSTNALKWHKEDGNLSNNAKQINGVLTIENIQENDAGNYLCIVEDEIDGRIMQSQPARINVEPTITPQIDPYEQTISENEPSRIRCWVPGNPSAILKWRKHGANLPKEAEDRGGVLLIPRTALHDAAETPRYEPPIRAEKPRMLEIDPPMQTVNVNEPSRIRCWLPDEPSATLKWYKEDGTLNEDAIDRDGVLTITKTLETDEGSYICTMDDLESGKTLHSAPAIIRVHNPRIPHVDPPLQTIVESNPAKIYCWVPGSPNAIISWRKLDGTMPSEAIEESGHLLIPHTHFADAGEYVCMAESSEEDEGAEEYYETLTSSPARIDVVARKPVPLYALLSLSSFCSTRIVYRCTVCTYLAHKCLIYLQEYEVTSERPIVDPPEQTVDEGEPVRFRCYVPNEHSARVRWSYGRPDGPLPPYVQDDRGLLTIRRADKTHSGEYFCTYDAPEGALHSAPARLHVNKLLCAEMRLETYKISQIVLIFEELELSAGGPPRPEASPADQTVQTGERARFHCEANSETQARIRWGYRAPDGPLRGDVVQEGDDVVINSADESNAGEYICTATNEYGTGEAAPVRLHVTENEEPPTARVVPRVWNGKPGDRHQFRCITTGVPPPQVTWTGPDGTQLPDDVNDIGGGVLDFSNGRADLNGDYTCTAVNIVGEASDHGSVNIGPSLTVRTTPPGPKIVLTAGEPLEVKCEAFGEPEPEVEWLHDPGPERGDLPDDFKPVTISEQFIRHPSIGIGNAGVYTCKGSNSQATATKDIHVEVVEASRVATVAILGGSTQWLEPGSPAELICAATGNSLIDRIQWVKTDGDLPPDVEDHNEPGILHFANFKSSDSGVYECRGYRNDEQIANAQVTIHPTNGGPLGAARVEIDEPNIRVVNHGDSIVLKCSVHEVDQPHRITWIHARDALRKTPQTAGYGSILHLQTVDPAHQGPYWVVVEFPSGERLYSRPAYVIVRPRSMSGGENNGANFEWALLRSGSVVRQLSRDDTLTIKRADASNDFGVYRCEVEDDDGQLLGAAYTAVTIAHSGSSNAQIVKFDEKSEATITCPVYAVPGAEVTWEKQDGSLPDDAVTSRNKLLIQEFDDAATGTYICRVSVEGQEIEGYVTALIYVPDTIIQVLLEASSESVALGDRAWFDCKVAGDPDAVITWSREGEEDLPDNAQKETYYTRDPICGHVTGNRLLFVNVREDNGGIYKCHAQTKEDGLPNANAQRVKDAQPLIRAVGQEAHLVCPAAGARGVIGAAKWEKIGGELPYAHSVRDGILILKDLSRSDNGVYKCTLLTETGMATVTHINLQVSDFIPSFDGAGFLKLKSMTIDDWQNVNIKLSVKPKTKDGLIFYTARQKEGEEKVDNFISVGLRRGRIVYRYDVGNGAVEVASSYPIHMNEWHRIELRNNPEKAMLYVDADDVIERRNEIYAISEAPATDISIGGAESFHLQPDDSGFTRGLHGSISEITVSGTPIDIGRDVLAKSGTVEQSTICSLNPCQHGGLCVPTNVHRGFVCDCDRALDYEGEFCERRSRKCNGEKCVSGSCLIDDDGIHRCLCPYGRTGRLCEDFEDQPLEAISFNGENSFLSLPPPTTLRNYTLEMLVRPREMKDQLVAYVGSEYDTKRSNFMGVTIRNGKFVYVYNNGDGNVEVEAAEPIEEGNTYKIEMKRLGLRGELRVNGKKAASKTRLAPFQAGTDLFVGGLPPGVSPHRRLNGVAPLNGCVYKIVVNGEEMDLKKLAITSSGGISECKEPLVTTTPLPSTTSRPTYKTITTQTPVAKAHTTTVPVTSCAGGGKFIDLQGKGLEYRGR
uniref:Basement membrane proteoglycan n=1 Tax=Ascaris lumbricoides TaxID=6252 RepID=A0A9J2P054_ASCLU